MQKPNFSGDHVGDVPLSTDGRARTVGFGETELVCGQKADQWLPGWGLGGYEETSGRMKMFRLTIMAVTCVEILVKSHHTAHLRPVHFARYR